MEEPREKTSFALRPSVRLRLGKLRQRLLEAGLARSTASEAAILEALILTADFDTVLTRLSR